MSDRAAEKRCGGDGFLVFEHFDVGQASGVIDADMQLLPDDPARACAPITVGAMSRPADASELPDVDVHEFARALALIPIGRLGRLDPQELPKPDPREHRRDRESRIARHCAISQAVIDSRRNAAIVITRASRRTG